MKPSSRQILAVQFPDAGVSSLDNFAVSIRHQPAPGETASSNRPTEPRKLAALPAEPVSAYHAFHRLAH